LVLCTAYQGGLFMSVTDVAPFTRAVPGLLLSVSAEGSATVIGLRGEADIATVSALTDLLVDVIAQHAGDVVVDLSQSDFIDSATVRALARAGQFLAERDRHLSIRSPSRLAVRVLTLHDLFHLVEPAPSPRAALRAARDGHSTTKLGPVRRSAF
jgi:anti-anti-sigma factor